MRVRDVFLLCYVLITETKQPPCAEPLMMQPTPHPMRYLKRGFECNCCGPIPMSYGSGLLQPTTRQAVARAVPRECQVGQPHATLEVCLPSLFRRSKSYSTHLEEPARTTEIPDQIEATDGLDLRPAPLNKKNKHKQMFRFMLTKEHLELLR